MTHESMAAPRGPARGTASGASSGALAVTPLELRGLLLIQLAVHGDRRGFFTERFHLDRFRRLGLPTAFVQDNHSRSAPGVIRGLHYQYAPPQGKLVGVTRGRIWDVAVDIRPGSRTFGGSVSAELSDMNGRLLWIPAGFAHGFCVLGDEPADVLYKVDAPYAQDGEGEIRWNDESLGIEWPVDNPVASERDTGSQSFSEYTAHPPTWPR